MTREKQINDAVKTSITETLMSTPNYEFSPRATDMLECAFTKGAEWADAHPVNPWHKVSAELPKVDKYRKCIKVFARRGDDVLFVAFYSVVAGFSLSSSFYTEYTLSDITHWMYIPEIKED